MKKSLMCAAVCSLLVLGSTAFAQAVQPAVPNTHSPLQVSFTQTKNFSATDLVGKWLDSRSIEKCALQITLSGATYHIAVLTPNPVCQTMNDQNTTLTFNDKGVVTAKVQGAPQPVFTGNMTEDMERINWADNGGAWLRQK